MGFNVTQRNGEVFLVAAADTKVSGNQKVPGYNDAWGKGRGFREGQTLPDIPLINLKGEEVRLGQFLGKQYVLYGWASW